MGTAAVSLHLELRQRGLFKNMGSVIAMGSQELMMTKPQFERMVGAAGIDNYDRNAFANLDHWPKSPRCSAENFYRLLGFNDYQCIDLDKEHGAIAHDLNLPFTDSSYHGQYDLVTDYGNNEHIFNITESYRTMHRLCKRGGMILISQMTHGANGYYNFDLAFFEGMAAANNYRILFCSYVVTLYTRYLSEDEIRELPSNIENIHRSVEYHIPLSQDLLDVVNWSRDRASLGICYVFEKLSDDDFKYPYQGEYQTQAQGNPDGNHGYQFQFLPVPPSRTYVPVRGLPGGDARQGLLESVGIKTMARHLVRRVLRRVRLRGK